MALAYSYICHECGDLVPAYTDHDCVKTYTQSDLDAAVEKAVRERTRYIEKSVLFATGDTSARRVIREYYPECFEEDTP